MSETFFSSQQTFVVHSYATSHGLLLLRNRKAGSDQKRIDILFQDVRAMELRAWFSNFEIREESVEFLSQFESNPLEMMEPGLRVFGIDGQGWRGYVLAGSVRAHADDGGFFDVSPLIEPQSA